MEIITVMVEWELTHRDSLGHTHTLSAGEVQVLSAGSGIIHSEMNAGHRPCRFLQIWIEPDSRDGLPAYDQRRYAIGNTWIPLIDPAQADAAMSLQRQVRLWRAKPFPERSLTLPVAPGMSGWLQIIDGGIQVELEADQGMQSGQLEKGDGLGFQPGVIRSITALGPGADVLLFELR
jgi:redox-sensitive bicupin YhaK (pirin superfamily)